MVFNPVRGYVSWLRDLTGFFSWQFIAFIFFAQHLPKGLLLAGGSGGVVYALKDFSFRAVKVPPSQMNVYSAVVSSPWSLKPFLGFMTDSVILFHSRTRYILVTLSILSAVAFSTIAMFGRAADEPDASGAASPPPLTAPLLAVLFFFVTLHASWSDLITEAEYTSRIRHVADKGADVVGWVWGGIHGLGMVGFAIAGPMVDALGPFVTAWVGVPVAASLLVPSLLGWLDSFGEGGPGREPPLAALRAWQRRAQRREALAYDAEGAGTADDATSGLLDETAPASIRTTPSSASPNRMGLPVAPARPPFCGVAMTLIRTHPPIFRLAMCLLVVTSSTTVLSLCGASAAQLATLSIVGCCVTMSLAYATLPRVMAKALIFNYLSSALVVDYSSASFLWYTTDAPECVACPRFSPSFYVTVIGVVSGLFGMVGTFIFTRYLRSWPYPRAIIVTQLLVCVTSFLDVLQFSSIVTPDPIPQELFMIGKTAAVNVVSMLNFLPGFLLLSRCCPPNAEATAFALMAGVSNYGGVTAAYMGAVIMRSVGLDNDNAYTYLPHVALLGVVVPVVVIAIAPLLLPNVPMDCDLPDARPPCPSPTEVSPRSLGQRALGPRGDHAATCDGSVSMDLLLNTDLAVTSTFHGKGGLH